LKSSDPPQRNRVETVARAGLFHCIRAETNFRIVFGKQLRLLRLEKGVSQEKLAEMADLHRNYVGVLERGGQNPSLDAICKLASALKVKAGELLVNLP
jgi:DNA-binding XRE family transcriptional regulator